MTDTALDEDRTSALDRFASVPTPTRNNSIVPQHFGSPADRVFGAVDVAVQRDEARILQKLKALAAAAGDDWYYRFPVRKKGGGQDWIEGASIKLANDVARIYGNCDVDCRAQDLGDSWLFYARFTDFETGYTLTRPFQQRKSQGSLKTDSDRALDIAFQIGASKAIRNVVVNALQTFSDFAFSEARNSLVTKIGQNLDGWRGRTVQGIANIPVDLVRVEAVIGRPAKDWLAPDIARIVAMMKSIADGMATVDETFPAPDKQVDTEQESEQADTGKLNEFAGEGGTHATTAKEPEKNDPPKETPKDNDSGKSKPETDSGGKTDGKPADETPPKNEAEWKVYAQTWIAEQSNAEAALARWAREKNLRNKANVSEEVREAVKLELDKKVAALKGQG
jgi:hypothetical protein